MCHFISILDDLDLNTLSFSGLDQHLSALTLCMYNTGRATECATSYVIE